LYAGVATAKNNLANTDVFSLPAINRFAAYAELTDPMMQPFSIAGQKKFVCIMHPIQALQLQTSTSENDWLAIQKAVGMRGSENLIYTGALGEYDGVVLHKHRNVVTFNDYGSGANLNAARALFLGAQAGILAYGQEGSPQRMSWNEETDDRGNALAITAGAIFGAKKSRYNSKDLSAFVMDSYIPAVF
jgi:N4-gp56 family major capsid protein